MNRKLTADAFEYYFGLGPDRSYQAVAEKYGVSKKTVVAAAKREEWRNRIAERERQATKRVEERAVESLTAMKERHLKMIRAVQTKALESLRNMPIDSGYQAVQALVKAIEQERLARGEPTERTALSMEDVIKREYERWFVPVEDVDADD
jgi:transposase